MTEIRSLGKIDIKILEKEYGKIQTDESNGVQGVQTRLKRKDRFESK